jgi:hypothetical protein
VGERLAKVHAATARQPELAARFPTDELFHALRLDPYLASSARAVPSCAEPLHALIAQTTTHRLALVHGDVSPKNLLVGPHGPVLLDAECAWWGDPAFDLAFCLNHLLLKGARQPLWTDRYLACFTSLCTSYLAGVVWEPPSALETRAARLLPGLLLARVAGKSPVEYLTEPWQQALVNAFAQRCLLRPLASLAELGSAWEGETSKYSRQVAKPQC